MIKPIAFMPLTTYAEAISDQAVLAAAAFAQDMGCGVQVYAYAAEIPQTYTPIGDVAFDIQGLIEGAQKASRAEADRIQAMLKAGAPKVTFHYHANMAPMHLAAASEARLYDLVVVPWQKGAVSMQEMAEAMIFSAGRPTVLVPASSAPAAIAHLAVAWDDSRVAARALNDALPYVAKGGHVSVLGADDRDGRSAALAKALAARGYKAQAVAVEAGSLGIGAALQKVAQDAGANLLAMGGFGHSRLRDFVLGGATKDVLADLTMPVMLSH